MTQKLIKIRQKPKAPKRKRILEEHVIFAGTTLATMVDIVALRNASLSDAYIGQEPTYDGYSDDLYLRFPRAETDEEFSYRMELYEARLSDWQSWYDVNEKLIGKELIRREAEKKKADAQAAADAAKKRQTTIQKLKRKLERLEAQT